MSIKIKRKPRKVMANKYNLLFPVELTKLGTEEDVCFGKHQDLKAPECQRCGDSELCQIVMAQKLSIMRRKAEKSGKFRDIEEEEIYKKKRPKQKLTKTVKIKRAIRAMVRKHKEIDPPSLIRSIAAMQEVTHARVQKNLDSLLKTTHKFILTKNKQLLKWKDQ